MGALVLFVPKKDKGLQLYVNYYSFNRITIKNRILLLFILEILDYLNQAIVFIKLDLKDTYNYI